MALNTSTVTIGASTKVSDFTQLLDNDLDLAGTGRTTETIKTNADNIASLSSTVLVLKGCMSVMLTDYTGTIAPTIAARAVIEINGFVYSNLSSTAISGATVSSTWYDILATPSGSGFTTAYVARGTGIWSDDNHGLYSGDNRVIGCIYRDGTGLYINKNVFDIVNRTATVKMRIGSWNMDASANCLITHGVNKLKIRGLWTTILSDTGKAEPLLFLINGTSAVISGAYQEIETSTITLMRIDSQRFDTTVYNDPAVNRGWVTMLYEL